MGALGLVFALLGAAMLDGFRWELGRRADVTIMLPGLRREPQRSDVE